MLEDGPLDSASGLILPVIVDESPEDLSTTFQLGLPPMEQRSLDYPLFMNLLVDCILPKFESLANFAHVTARKVVPYLLVGLVLFQFPLLSYIRLLI